MSSTGKIEDEGAQVLFLAALQDKNERIIGSPMD
jgi:hypothetical protein